MFVISSGLCGVRLIGGMPRSQATSFCHSGKLPRKNPMFQRYGFSADRFGQDLGVVSAGAASDG